MMNLNLSIVVSQATMYLTCCFIAPWNQAISHETLIVPFDLFPFIMSNKYLWASWTRRILWINNYTTSFQILWFCKYTNSFLTGVLTPSASPLRISCLQLEHKYFCQKHKTSLYVPPSCLCNSFPRIFCTFSHLQSNLLLHSSMESGHFQWNITCIFWHTLVCKVWLVFVILVNMKNDPMKKTTVRCHFPGSWIMLMGRSPFSMIRLFVKAIEVIQFEALK